ncbi:hypothetical protein C5167_007964 [Papaver somniferum]|uniref:Uncharacterized protein n=1 Tax=Papaver somniferum TaxID=3469 RepID=A0A4Y7JT44_PAPSO|nr:hypothetical protein C5167_007964 [Papaver somniferum]
MDYTLLSFFMKTPPNPPSPSFLSSEKLFVAETSSLRKNLFGPAPLSKSDVKLTFSFCFLARRLFDLITHTTKTSSIQSTDFLPQAISKATTPKLKTSDSLLALPVFMYSGAK